MPSVLVGAFILLCVSVDWGDTRVVVDHSGNALHDVYVVYSYRGAEFNPVDSRSYYRAGSLAKTDEKGRLHIAPSVHLHRPCPLQAGLALVYDVIYCPRLHNAGSLFPGLSSAPGPITVDPGSQALVVRDQRGNPQGWYRSMLVVLGTVPYVIEGRYVGRNKRVACNADPGLKAEFLAAIGQDCNLFLAEYGNAVRPIIEPAAWKNLPAQERREKQKLLERRLTWKSYADVQWSRRLRQISAYLEDRRQTAP